MASGSFATGGVSVAPLAINQPAIYSGNFTWSSPIADLAANEAAAQRANYQATRSAPAAQAQPKPVASSKNPPKGDVSGANASGSAGYWNPGDATHAPKFVPDASGGSGGTTPQAQAAQPAQAASAAPTKLTTAQGNIPAGATVKNIGGTQVSLSDWAIQHLIDHHNDTTTGGAGSPNTGGPGAQ